MLGDDLRAELGAALPVDHAAQSFAPEVLRRQVADLAAEHPLVVDLGCGRGDGVDLVREVRPAAQWIGVDIAQSAEVDERRRADAEFRTFDGIHLPLEDASVDLIYTQQVFEHVEQPDPLLADVARVLRPGGVFCGSLSQLEAFHSRSVGGFTPYGWLRALERAGLTLDEVRPGIDVGTLLVRRLAGRRGRFDRYWVQESPGNRALRWAGRIKRTDAAGENALKLMFSGQFTFLAHR